MKAINEKEFKQEVLDSRLPVFVDFWAPWCGPCRTIEPVLEELSEEYAGRMKFVKINIDENPNISGEYKIMSIPTLKIFKDGEVVDRTAGVKSKVQLEELISKYV